jgi:hypothetical protein
MLSMATSKKEIENAIHYFPIPFLGLPDFFFGLGTGSKGSIFSNNLQKFRSPEQFSVLSLPHMILNWKYIIFWIGS